MSRILTRGTLAVSGATLGLIGSGLMFAPITFLEMSDVRVAHDAGLLSELVAPSGVLLITGMLMMLSAVKLRLAGLGLVCGAIVYGSYGIGRLVSVLVHGVPPPSLITATVVELGIAALLIILHRRQAHEL